ncbi:MAG: DUF4347 domain-containing protein [Cyanobacteria bacterium P01_G01_bin.54]
MAASTNLTGSAALGADWTLEKSTGNIEATLGFEPEVLADTVNLTNSNVSGNSSSILGGGIRTSGAIIRNSTIAHNTAGTDGGGIERWGGSGTIDIANSIIAISMVPRPTTISPPPLPACKTASWEIPQAQLWVQISIT